MQNILAKGTLLAKVAMINLCKKFNFWWFKWIITSEIQ